MCHPGKDVLSLDVINPIPTWIILTGNSSTQKMDTTFIKHSRWCFSSDVIVFTRYQSITIKYIYLIIINNLRSNLGQMNGSNCLFFLIELAKFCGHVKNKKVSRFKCFFFFFFLVFSFLYISHLFCLVFFFFFLVQVTPITI